MTSEQQRQQLFGVPFVLHKFELIFVWKGYRWLKMFRNPNKLNMLHKNTLAHCFLDSNPVLFSFKTVILLLPTVFSVSVDVPDPTVIVIRTRKESLDQNFWCQSLKASQWRQTQVFNKKKHKGKIFSLLIWLHSMFVTAFTYTSFVDADLHLTAIALNFDFDFAASIVHLTCTQWMARGQFYNLRKFPKLWMNWNFSIA